MVDFDSFRRDHANLSIVPELSPVISVDFCHPVSSARRCRAHLDRSVAEFSGFEIASLLPVFPGFLGESGVSEYRFSLSLIWINKRRPNKGRPDAAPIPASAVLPPGIKRAGLR
ncbi:MAG: hypothetical protein ACLP8B_09515 [Xanthobacteraceae bacterium]